MFQQFNGYKPVRIGVDHLPLWWTERMVGTQIKSEKKKENCYFSPSASAKLPSTTEPSIEIDPSPVAPLLFLYFIQLLELTAKDCRRRNFSLPFCFEGGGGVSLPFLFTSLLLPFRLDFHLWWSKLNEWLAVHNATSNCWLLFLEVKSAAQSQSITRPFRLNRISCDCSHSVFHVKVSFAVRRVVQCMSVMTSPTHYCIIQTCYTMHARNWWRFLFFLVDFFFDLALPSSFEFSVTVVDLVACCSWAVSWKQKSRNQNCVYVFAFCFQPCSYCHLHECYGRYFELAASCSLQVLPVWSALVALVASETLVKEKITKFARIQELEDR